MNHFSREEKEEYGRPPEIAVRFVRVCSIFGKGAVGSPSPDPSDRSTGSCVTCTPSRRSSASTCIAAPSAIDSAISSTGWMLSYPTEANLNPIGHPTMLPNYWRMQDLVIRKGRESSFPMAALAVGRKWIHLSWSKLIMGRNNESSLLSIANLSDPLRHGSSKLLRRENPNYSCQIYQSICIID